MQLVKFSRKYHIKMKFRHEHFQGRLKQIQSARTCSKTVVILYFQSKCRVTFWVKLGMSNTQLYKLGTPRIWENIPYLAHFLEACQLLTFQWSHLILQEVRVLAKCDDYAIVNEIPSCKFNKKLCTMRVVMIISLRRQSGRQTILNDIKTWSKS